MKIKQSNNPQLTKLMETEMTFKELEQEKLNLRVEEILLNSKIGYCDNFTPELRFGDDYKKLVDRLEIVKDLLIGVDCKLREKGFLYKITYRKLIKKEYPSEQTIYFDDYKYLLVENKFNEPLSGEDKGKILEMSKMLVPYEILDISLIKK